jgi:hypothetical protein
MGLVARWVTTSLALGFGLGGALLAMQAPAFTEHYLAGLAQAEGELDRSIADRLRSGQEIYGLTGTDREVVTALAAREPSNALTLGRDLDRRAGYAEILNHANSASSPVRPFAVAWAIADGPEGWRSPVLDMAFASYDPGISLTPAALVWGLGGLVLGEFVAQLLAAPFHRRRRGARFA